MAGRSEHFCCRQRDLHGTESKGRDRRASQALSGVGVTGRKQLLVVGLIVVVVASLAAAGKYFLADELEPVGLGAKAPDFVAMTLDPTPKKKTLADYKGQVVLINIWATWCGPCRVEMPSIEKLN